MICFAEMGVVFIYIFLSCVLVMLLPINKHKMIGINLNSAWIIFKTLSTRTRLDFGLATGCSCFTGVSKDKVRISQSVARSYYTRGFNNSCLILWQFREIQRMDELNRTICHTWKIPITRNNMIAYQWSGRGEAGVGGGAESGFFQR